MNVKSLVGPIEDRIELEAKELAVIKKAMSTKLWNRDQSKEDRLPKFQQLYTDLAAEFNVDAPELQLSGSDELGYGFDRETNTVTINKLSLTTALTAFYASVKNQQDGVTLEDNVAIMKLAEDSGFGLSAFKQAAPAMFREAKAAGRLHGTDVRYTDGGRIQPALISTAGPACGGDADSDDGIDDSIDDSEDAPPKTEGEGNDADRGNGAGED